MTAQPAPAPRYAIQWRAGNGGHWLVIDSTTGDTVAEHRQVTAAHLDTLARNTTEHGPGPAGPPVTRILDTHPEGTHQA